MSSSIHLSNVSGEHTSQIKVMSDVLFGKGYASEEAINDYCSIGYGLVVMIDTDVAGFSLFRPVDRSELTQHVRVSEEWIGNNLPVGNIGLRRSTGVRPEYRGRHIGPLLVRESMSRLNEFAGIISVVWDQGGKHIGPLLKRNGMEMALELPEYWGTDSVARKYNCPECGAPPCSCKAYIYIKINEK